MMKILVILLLTAVPVQAQTQCVSVDTVKHDIAEKYKTTRVRTITGSEMVSFMIGFNAILPATNVIADTGVVMDDPTKPSVAIILFNAGCYSTMIFLRKKEYIKLLGEMI